MEVAATDREKLLTAPQAAVLLGLNHRTLDNWRQRRAGPAFIRVGSHIRYSRRDLDLWLSSRRVDPSAMEPKEKPAAS